MNGSLLQTNAVSGDIKLRHLQILAIPLRHMVPYGAEREPRYGNNLYVEVSAELK